MEEHERTSTQWERAPVRRRRSSAATFSLFVGNLTFDTGEDDLLRIFSRYGKLRDVFIPRNRQLNRPRGFAFIRFCYEQDAFNAINCLNGRRIDGRVVHIDWAKGQQRRDTIEPESPHPRHQETKQRNMNTSVRSFAATVSAPKVSANIQMAGGLGFTTIADSRAVENRLQKLKLALVGTTFDSNVRIVRLLDALKASSLKSAEVEIVRISAQKFLLTLQSVEDFEAFKTDSKLHNEMGLQMVEKWSPTDVIGSGGVWIRIFGIPAQAWIESVILDLASFFGKIIQIDSNSRFGYFQAFARIRVIPRLGVCFNQVLELKVLGNAYPIFVEMEPLFNYSCSSSIQQVTKESTKVWVMRRFHGQEEPLPPVCEKAAAGVDVSQIDKAGQQADVCLNVNLEDSGNKNLGKNAQLVMGGMFSTINLRSPLGSRRVTEGVLIEGEADQQSTLDGSKGNWHAMSSPPDPLLSLEMPENTPRTHSPRLEENHQQSAILGFNYKQPHQKSIQPDLSEKEGVLEVSILDTNEPLLLLDRADVSPRFLPGRLEESQQIGTQVFFRTKQQLLENSQEAVYNGEDAMLSGLQPYVIDTLHHQDRNPGMFQQDEGNSLQMVEEPFEDEFAGGKDTHSLANTCDLAGNRKEMDASGDMNDEEGVTGLQQQDQENIIESREDGEQENHPPNLRQASRTNRTEANSCAENREAMDVRGKCSSEPRWCTNTAQLVPYERRKKVPDRAILEVDLSPYFSMAEVPINRLNSNQDGDCVRQVDCRSEESEQGQWFQHGEVVERDIGNQETDFWIQEVRGEIEAGKTPKKTTRHRILHAKGNWESRLRRLKKRALNTGCVTDG